MIIGILVADDLDTTVVEEFGDYGSMFRKLLSSNDADITFRNYAVTEKKLPENLNECDAYLITGSKFSCYDDVLWIKRLKQFVVSCYEQHVKLIGICFGHQMIAHSLGGKVEKSINGWGVGCHTSQIYHNPEWLKPAHHEFNLLVSHQDQVLQLPQQAVLIAGNDFCPIASFQMNDTILTFQGHPEFDRDYLQYLLLKRRAIFGEERYTKAYESLAQPVDDKPVSKWIIQFIEQPTAAS